MSWCLQTTGTCLSSSNSNGLLSQHSHTVESVFSTISVAPSPFSTSTTPTAFGNNTTPLPFSSNVNMQSAFSNNTGSGPSPFGATTTQTQSVFGGGPNINNATVSKPTEASRTQFGFTQFNTTPNAAPASSSTTTAKATPAPTFSFGNKNPQTPAAAPQSQAHRQLYRSSASILHNNLGVQRLRLVSKTFFPDAKGWKIFHESAPGSSSSFHFTFFFFFFCFHILFVCLTALDLLPLLL